MLKLKKPFLIAEIGINHNGNINLAKKMIEESKKQSKLYTCRTLKINIIFTKFNLIYCN